MKRALAILIAICALFAAVASGLPGLAEESDDIAIFGDFSVSDINGDEQTQAIFENAPLTLVNIWGTFCPPCLDEMPDLGALAEEYEGKVQFLGVVSDAYIYPDGVSQQIVDEAVLLAEQTGADAYVHLVPDEGMVIRVLSAIQVVPTTFFLDGEGKMVGSVVFGSRGKDEWIEIIEETLALLPDVA